MGNMKELLGDMTLEEFEVERKLILEKVKAEDVKKFIGWFYDTSNNVYDYWLEIQGKELAQKWVADHGGYVVVDRLNEFQQCLMDNFIVWLERDN